MAKKKKNFFSLGMSAKIKKKVFIEISKDHKSNLSQIVR